MAQTQSERVLGEYEITTEDAADDPNFRVLELPGDMVENHITATFRPERYAKICRDVAYFSRGVGSAPTKNVGDGTSSPGSGMRRAKEGALYHLAHREALLSRAVELGFIEITNSDRFEAPEDTWTFEIAPRGCWYLHHYYGDHVPVRHIKKVKLSRWSTATNQRLVVVDSDTAANAKSVDEWNQQVENQQMGMGDVDTGYYHVSEDTVDDPGEDPAGEDLIAWIDESNKPKQFDVDTVDGDVQVTCDVETLAEPFEEDFTINYVSLTLDAETGDIVIVGPTTEKSITVIEDNDRKLGIKGEYEAFVPSGAKDALKAATDAEWSDDYQRWYVVPEEFLAGVEAMLTDSDASCVSCPAHIVAKYTEYL